MLCKLSQAGEVVLPLLCHQPRIEADINDLIDQGQEPSHHITLHLIIPKN